VHAGGLRRHGRVPSCAESAEGLHALLPLRPRRLPPPLRPVPPATFLSPESADLQYVADGRFVGQAINTLPTRLHYDSYVKYLNTEAE